jgi:hypothetical protein
MVRKLLAGFDADTASKSEVRDAIANGKHDWFLDEVSMWLEGAVQSLTASNEGAWDP